MSNNTNKFESNLLIYADKAFLSIQSHSGDLIIKHRFSFKDNSILGVIIFLLGGLFFVSIPFIRSVSTTTQVIALAIGGLLFAFSLLTILRQNADYLKISDKSIEFRYNLRYSQIHYSKSMSIKLKTEFVNIKRVATIGSRFILVTIFLISQSKEIPILNFKLDATDEDVATELGNNIIAVINEKLYQIG